MGAHDAGPVAAALFPPSAKLIREAQKRRLSRVVAEIAALRAKVGERPRGQAPVWAALCAEFDVISYHLIPFAMYERAVEFLEGWRHSLARETDSAAGSNRDWRARCYLFICAVLTQIGQQDELPRMLEQRYGGRSPQELTDEELDEVCRLVAQRNRLCLAGTLAVKARSNG